MAAASLGDDPATLTGIPAVGANGSEATPSRPDRRGGWESLPVPTRPRRPSRFLHCIPRARTDQPTLIIKPTGIIRWPPLPASSHARHATRPRVRRQALVGGAACGAWPWPQIVLGVLALLAAGVYVGAQSVYFIGTNSRGLVTLFSGFPYELPGGVKLYSKDFVTGVSASTLSATTQRTLLDHSLRSEGDATELVRSLERGELE